MQLIISLLGTMKIAFDELSEEVRLTRATQELLAYLLLNNHRHHPREVILGLFWGDYPEQRARNCLNTALWRLRHALEPEGVARGVFLETNHLGEIRFNHQSDYWLDVEVLLQQANSTLHRPYNAITVPEIEALQQALRLYQGQLLEGFYSDWVLRYREHIHMTFLNSLQYLMNYHQQQRRFEESLHYAQQILEFDPLREEIHREVMRLYHRLGQRALAIRQYEQCRSALAESLDLQPMPETENLHRQLMAGLLSGGEVPSRVVPAVEPLPMTTRLADTSSMLSLLTDQLQLTRQTLFLFHEQFQKALEILESLRRL